VIKTVRLKFIASESKPPRNSATNRLPPKAVRPGLSVNRPDELADSRFKVTKLTELKRQMSQLLSSPCDLGSMNASPLEAQEPDSAASLEFYCRNSLIKKNKPFERCSSEKRVIRLPAKKSPLLKIESQTSINEQTKSRSVHKSTSAPSIKIGENQGNVELRVSRTLPTKPHADESLTSPLPFVCSKRD
jgi:hypothetical protein